MALLKIISETSQGTYLVEMPRSVVDSLRPGLAGAGTTVEADPAALAVLGDIGKIGDWFASLQRRLDAISERLGDLPQEITDRVEQLFTKLDEIDGDIGAIATALHKATRAAKRKQIGPGEG